MRYPEPLVEATALRRYKRFLCDVRLPDGTETVAHCADSGSMRTCFEAGAPCRLSRSRNPKRKLGWTLEQIRLGAGWAMVHPARANEVVAEALAADRVPELSGYARLQREQRRGGRGSRFDLLLTPDAEDAPRAWVEVKNVTFYEDGRLMFPDAVTTRGARHLDELVDVVAQGDRAVLLYHVGRSEGRVVEPAEHVDPHYARALRRAVEAGVEVLAHRCRVEAEGLELGDSLPVELGTRPEPAAPST